MKRVLLLLCIILLIFFEIISVTNAQPPCDPDIVTYYYKLQRLGNYLPINADMPSDVLRGYIVADSILKTFNSYEISDFINRQDPTIFSDSLKHFLKYYYNLIDYDPVTAYQFSIEEPIRYADPRNISRDLLYFFAHTPDSGVQYNLSLKSYYILHVNISDTTFIHGVGGEICHSLTVINASVIDTSKGKVFPPISSGTNKIGKRNIDKIQSGSGADLVFQYCNQWSPASVTIDDGIGGWVKPGKEYIVFLEFRYICTHFNDIYITITPHGDSRSASSGMYPIENGIMIDESNDWGLGKNVPINEFKDHLRKMIDNIKNYSTR